MEQWREATTEMEVEVEVEARQLLTEPAEMSGRQRSFEMRTVVEEDSMKLAVWEYRLESWDWHKVSHWKQNLQ